MSRSMLATSAKGSGLPCMAMPALFTRMSTRPQRDSAQVARSRTCCSSVRSAALPSASKPSARSSATRWAIRALLAVTINFAPAAPSRRAIAMPMPSSLPAPLTSATWPCQPVLFISRS
ncbi:hypothetical protein D3C84_978200 [compost metagenome]